MATFQAISFPAEPWEPRQLPEWFRWAEDSPVKELINLIERDQGADGGVGQQGAGVDHHLLGLFDDSAVTAADVTMCSPFEPQPRNNVDAEIDLVRQIRIQLDEVIFVQRDFPAGAFQFTEGVEPSLIRLEKLCQNLFT